MSTQAVEGHSHQGPMDEVPGLEIVPPSVGVNKGVKGCGRGDLPCNYRHFIRNHQGQIYSIALHFIER